MASCFQAPVKMSNAEDSVVLFSASNSPDCGEAEDTTSSYSSSSSRSHHHSPKQTHPFYAPKSFLVSHRLTVTNLSYSVSLPPPSLFSRLFQKPTTVNILKSVSFEAESSEILGIVGPSGTGKSTLLKIISGRVKQKELDPSATISINDQKILNPSQLRNHCGFVPQEDDLLPLLTVKETLMYSAGFRLRESTPKDREKRVNVLMRDLGLLEVADSFVGEGDEESRGISGGERKRVSIAAEMIRDPPLLLLDEPTSGLDSKSSLHVIELIASMAKSKRRTVVLSIHQPSYRILKHVSRLLILSSGSVVHNGTIESLEDSITRLGFQIPTQLNPVEFAMEIMHSLETLNSTNRVDNSPAAAVRTLWPHEDGEQRERRTEMNLKGDFRLSDVHKIFFFVPRTKQRSLTRTARDVQHRGQFHLFDMHEIFFLVSRMWKIIYRTKQLFLARTAQALVGGFGLGSVYVRVGRDEDGIAERLGLFAFSLSFLLSSTVEALPIYLHERRVLMKESSRGAYRISSYILANTITFLPFLFIVSLLFSVPVYWIVGLNPSLHAFAFFLLVVWLIVMMASSLVMFLSAVSPDFISGNSLITTVLGAFFLFSGYFIPKESIPKYWIFMYYVSLYRYPLDAMLVNEYWSAREECFSWGEGDGGSLRCAKTGTVVLGSRGLDKDIRWVNVWIMFGFFVLYRLVCWVVLARKASRSTI